MTDDLFRVFKSVRKLVREKTEDLLGNVSPLERTLRDVVDEDSCAVSNSLLRHIAVTTNDAFAYSTVAQVVWQGISSEFWQRIYKCLCLLEYMILLGPERCRQDCADAQMTIRSLTQYRFHDGRREQGGGVRQKAENILKLINDAEYWNIAKQQAIRDTEKYSGGIENEPYISSISHMNIHTRATNPFFTGPQAMPPMAFGASGANNPFNQAAAFGRGQSDAGAYFARQGPGMSPSWRGGYGGAAPVRGGRLGLYDPGDDFATDDPFGESSVPAQTCPSPSSMDPFKESPAAPTLAAPVPAALPSKSLLDDDFLETVQPNQQPTIPQASVQSTNNKSQQNSLLPDLLE